MRHDYIKKFVASSVFVTFCFGVSSVLYLNHQSKFEGLLDQKQSIKAFGKSLRIDEKFLISDLERFENGCHLAQPQTCNILAKSMLVINNRIEDYRIFFEKTLQIDPNSKIFAELNEFSGNINQLAQNTFGISFVSAKASGIITIEDFLNLSQENISSGRTQVNAKASSVALMDIKQDLIAELDSYIKSYQETEARIHVSYSELNQYFLILIILELLLFFIVNLIDIANNNVEAGKEDQFGIRGIQPKVKPLLVSLSFSLVVIAASQYALKLEQKNSLSSYCRDLNQQNINFMNTISSYGEHIKEYSFYQYFAIDDLCIEFMTTSAQKDMAKLRELSIQNPDISHEVFAEVSRIQADNIQEKQSENSSSSRTILSLVLIFNVLSLAAMSIFLGFDSADIGTGSRDESS